MNPIFYLLSALIAAAVWVASAPPVEFKHKGKAASVLTSAHLREDSVQLEDLDANSLAYRLLASGWSIHPATFRADQLQASPALIAESDPFQVLKTAAWAFHTKPSQNFIKSAGRRFRPGP